MHARMSVRHDLHWCTDVLIRACAYAIPKTYRYVYEHDLISILYYEYWRECAVHVFVYDGERVCVYTYTCIMTRESMCA